MPDVPDATLRTILDVLIDYGSCTSDDLIGATGLDYDVVIAALDVMILDGGIDALVAGATTWYRAMSARFDVGDRVQHVTGGAQGTTVTRWYVSTGTGARYSAQPSTGFVSEAHAHEFMQAHGLLAPAYYTVQAVPVLR